MDDFVQLLLDPNATGSIAADHPSPSSSLFETATVTAFLDGADVMDVLVDAEHGSTFGYCVIA